MKRYSRPWWLVILLTSVIIGSATFLLLQQFTALGDLKLVLAVTVLALLGDLLIAVSMEAIAPSKVDVGPGERMFVSDAPSEIARVHSGFISSSHGKVAVRGELWSATRAPDDSGDLSVGASVRVIGRDGLTLIVSTKAN